MLGIERLGFAGVFMIRSWDDFMDAVALLPRWQQVAVRQEFWGIIQDQLYKARRARLSVVPKKGDVNG